MEYTFTDCSLEDLLFSMPSKINPPMPLPQNILPKFSSGGQLANTGLRTPNPVLDTSKPLMHQFSIEENFTKFIDKNWISIFAVLSICAGVYIYQKVKERDQEKKTIYLPFKPGYYDLF